MIISREEYSNITDELRTLFEKVFSRQLSNEFLRWRYLDNPYHDVLAALQRDTRKIIANYSASPCLLNVFGEKQKSALSMTTMTDPDHAGKGYFTTLANELYHQMQAAGYQAIWGFPNANSHAGLVKRLQWEDIAEIPTLTAKLTELKFSSPALNLARDDQFLLNYEDLAVDASTIEVNRNQAHLQWRYASHPVNTYKTWVIASEGKVSSYCVTKDYEHFSIDIVDFKYSALDEAEALITQVLSDGITRNKNKVSVWCSLHSPLHVTYEKKGFRSDAPLTFFGARWFEGQAPGHSRDVYDFRNWRLQMGDSDVY